MGPYDTTAPRGMAKLAIFSVLVSSYGGVAGHIGLVAPGFFRG